MELLHESITDKAKQMASKAIETVKNKSADAVDYVKKNPGKVAAGLGAAALAGGLAYANRDTIQGKIDSVFEPQSKAAVDAAKQYEKDLAAGNKTAAELDKIRTNVHSDIAYGVEKYKDGLTNAAIGASALGAGALGMAAHKYLTRKKEAKKKAAVAKA